MKEDKVVPIDATQAKKARAEDTVALRNSITGIEQNIAAGEKQLAELRTNLAMQKRLLSYAEEGQAGE